MNNYLVKNLRSLFTTTLLTALSLLSYSATAQFVQPTLGGDQETPTTGASMKHAAINFDGTSISIDIDESIPTPILRELQAPNEFDPSKQWSVLTSKSYNAQHGWTSDGLWDTPTDTSIWIETVSASPELEIYEGGRYMSAMMIEMQSFDPIFGTDGAVDIWKWGNVMTHNAYAVSSPTKTSYEATYRVYIGDSVTGVESTDRGGSPLYVSDTVTFSFMATPVPEPTTSLLLAFAATASLIGSSRRS